MTVPFVKGHGLGNDYIVMEEATLSAPLSAAQIGRICDRNWGVGSDGILLRVPPWDGADFGLRILNPDGSEAEKSGNGLRIFGTRASRTPSATPSPCPREGTAGSSASASWRRAASASSR
jgi:diaminopimelate epimerase